MDEEQLLQLLSDPTMAKALSEMSAYGDRQNLLGQQSKIGASLFGTPGAQGRTVGQTYVASSPLEHISDAVQRIIGAQKMNNAMSGQQDLISGDMATRQRFASALAQAMQRAKQAQAQPGSYQAPQMAADGPPTASGELPTVGY